MSPEKREDKALQDYLKGESPLSQTYRAAAMEEPPAHVDEAILATARKAVRTRPKVVRGPFASHWMIPVSLAAVLVLTVGLVTFLSEEKDVLLPEGHMPAAPAEAVVEDSFTVRPELDTGRRDSKKGLMAPATRPAPVMERKRAADRKEKAADARKAGSLPAPVLSKERGTAEEAAPAQAPAKSAPLLLRMREFEKREAFQAPVSGSVSDKPDGLSPEAWLKQIAELRRQGKHQEAEESLKAFRKRYPDYPVEKELKKP